MVRPRENRLNKSGRDFRALLERADLDKESAADLLGISARNVRGYADGSRAVPVLVTRFIQAYIVYDIKLKRLK